MKLTYSKDLYDITYILIKNIVDIISVPLSILYKKNLVQVTFQII